MMTRTLSHTSRQRYTWIGTGKIYAKFDPPSQSYHEAIRHLLHNDAHRQHDTPGYK